MVSYNKIHVLCAFLGVAEAEGERDPGGEERARLQRGGAARLSEKPSGPAHGLLMQRRTQTHPRRKSKSLHPPPSVPGMPGFQKSLLLGVYRLPIGRQCACRQYSHRASASHTPGGQYDGFALRATSLRGISKNDKIFENMSAS